MSVFLEAVAATSALLLVAGAVFFYRARSAWQRDRDALRASEAKFARAFQASPDSYMISSLPEGVILAINEGFTAVTGFDSAESLGRTVRDLGLWSDLADRERMMRELQDAGRVDELEAVLRIKSGEPRECLISGKLIELDGRPALLTVTRDVSRERQRERERAALMRELEAKNVELERFTYTVSHDLKSPLFTIQGFLGLLEKDVERGDHERMLDDMKRIRTATETMRRLLDELLELSRIGRMMNPPQEVALGELVGEALERVAGRIDEVRVAVVIETDLPVVEGDRPRLLAVLQNLIDNAVKFMGEQREPRVELGTRPSTDGGGEVIYVRDNGIGVDPRFHDKIFGLFERLDSRVDGTGIGLALARRIVEVHGGRLWVESAGAGLGSTFCFTLAGAASFEAGRQGSKGSPAQSPPSGNSIGTVKASSSSPARST